MILSNVSIQKALDKGWLIITPEPEPRRKGDDGVECPYQTSSVDLRLGSEIAFFKDADIALNIDLRKGGFASVFGPHSKNLEISEQQPYRLQPNTFVLARTLERVQLPLQRKGPSLAARIEGRSSYARCGMLVHFTAPTIHAGFDGTITLEIINFGPIAILLTPGAPICQLIVEQVHGVPFANESQFQGQISAGGKKGDRSNIATRTATAKGRRSKRHQ